MLVDIAVTNLATWYLLQNKTINVVLSFQIVDAILEVCIPDHTSDLTRVIFDMWQWIQIVR